VPRTGRGGARSGSPGQSYANRTDLNQQRSRPLAVQTATHQTYGQALAQQQSQRAIPLAPPPAPTGPPGAGPAIGAGQVSTPPPAPTGGPLPGEVPGLGAASARPSEPLTAGLPTGPGAGPEALGLGQTGNLGQMLQSLANQSGNDTLMALAQRAKAMGQ
jgi:hypothetical protein